jgi:hypothetical protein
MAANESRDSKAIIKEAQLLYGSNDFIYKFFKEASKYSPEIDDIIEAKLLLKNDSFLDIVLAQYCQHSNTIFKLFTRAVQSNNLSLKLACLSNESFEGTSDSIPSALFGENQWSDCPLLLDWFRSISSAEIEVLFNNKSIDRDWLGSLLECNNEFWKILTEDQQKNIIRSLCKNPVIKSRDVGFFIDGQSEYDYKKLFFTIWSLPEKLPTSRQYAFALSSLLENTSFVISSFDAFEVAKRWDIIDETESKKDIKLFLNSYELVRFHLYKNVIKDLYGDDFSNKEHFDNADIAYRCCSYSQLKNITADDMTSIYYTKDEALAVNYLLMNDNLWAIEETREALQDLCYRADMKHPNGISFCTNDFLVRKMKMEELNPKWFIQKIFDDSDVDDKLLNVGTMREFLKELKEDSTNGILNLSNAYSKRILKIELILYTILLIVLINSF